MCFDYLYILGLTQNEDLANYVMEKDVFTDLMFKREKGIGCQARSCTLYKYLRTNGLVEQFISNPYEFNYIQLIDQVKLGLFIAKNPGTFYKIF